MKEFKKRMENVKENMKNHQNDKDENPNIDELILKPLSEAVENTVKLARPNYDGIAEYVKSVASLYDGKTDKEMASFVKGVAEALMDDVLIRNNNIARKDIVILIKALLADMALSEERKVVIVDHMKDEFYYVDRSVLEIGMDLLGLDLMKIGLSTSVVFPSMGNKLIDSLIYKFVDYMTK